jgi:iron complex outermembrane receptor protein
MSNSELNMRSIRLRALLLSASCAASLATGAQVHAQAVPPQPASSPNATPPTAAAATPKGGASTLSEVIVTATRSSESVQKTALAISVLGHEDLQRAGVTQAKDLSNLLPGVEVGSAGGAVQVYIRGVGTTATNGLAEEAVAFNLDGIYISRPTALNNGFFDVNRVEVLKGPQGTLYGKNSTGGAINVITNNPSTDKFSGDESLEIGNYGLVTEQLSLNIPVTDKFALRGAFNYARHDGYLSDGTDDENTVAGRLKALIKPTDNLTILLSADWSGLYGRGEGSVVHPAINPSNPWEAESSAQTNALLTNSALGGGYPGSHFAALGPYGLLAPITNNQGQNIQQWGLTSEINWNLGFGTLTSLTGYRQDPANYTSYVPGFFVRDIEADKQVSQEFRLGGLSGPVKWVVGAYYFNEQQDLSLYDNAGAVSSGLLHVPALDDTSYAGFGEITYSILPTLRLILGDRYTQEMKDITGSYTNGAGVVYPFQHSLNENANNYKVGFEYDLLPRSMLYFTTSTGFKSGGFYPNVGPDFFKPEKMTAYELGVKNRFLDNRLEVNLELYDWDYTNRQFSHLGQVTNAAGQSLGGTVLGTYNAGQANLKGVDVSAKMLLTKADILTVEMEYNNTNYSSFVYTQPYGFASAASNGCILGPNVNGTQSFDCSGKPLSRAPLWSGTIGFEHDFDLGSVGTVQANIRTHLSTSYWLDVDYVPSEKASGYTRSDLDLTYRPVVGNWSLAAYVHNLENGAVYSGGVEQPFVSGLTVATILPPRTFGGRFAVKF